MAKIKEIVEILLTDLVIGKGQVRIRDVGKDIDELAESISKLGLLEPIVVCPAEHGKYEILTGQRRFLAHQKLGKKTILAGVLDEKVDETQAKIISITENLVRRDPNSKDYIDACTALFKKYGSIKAVCEETGLPQSKVSLYIKYDRLKPEMKQLVDNGHVDMKTALRAQDAATNIGDYDPDEAVKLAKELYHMSGAQQERVVKKIEENPDSNVEDVIEAAKTGDKVTQIIVTLTSSLHQSLKQFANEEQQNIGDAAASLISEGLATKGFSDE